jgi:hypothetical protein
MIFCCTHTGSLKYDLPVEYQLVTLDLQGNNIWEKENYRHLRHIYYIYNNLELFNYPDIVTIFQYRRYMKVLDLPEGYDVVAPGWGYNTCTVGHQYEICHSKEILELSKQEVNSYHYLEFLETQMTNKYYHNIFTMRTIDFLEYCDFLFSTLSDIEKKATDFSEAAFIGERLGAYYLWRYYNPERILNSTLIEL